MNEEEEEGEEDDVCASASHLSKEGTDTMTLGKPKLSKSADVVTSAVQQLATRTKSCEGDSTKGNNN